MTFKDISKGSNAARPLQRPKIVQNRHIPRYNKKTKRLYFLRVLSLLHAKPKRSRIRILFRNWGTYLKCGHSQSPLSGPAIDDIPTFRRFFFFWKTSLFIHSQNKDRTAGDQPHRTFQKCLITFRNGLLFSAMRLFLSDLRSRLKQDAAEAMLLRCKNMI